MQYKIKRESHGHENLDWVLDGDDLTPSTACCWSPPLKVMTPPASIKSSTSGSSDAATQLPNLKSLYVSGNSGFPHPESDSNHFSLPLRDISPPPHERILQFLNEKTPSHERSPPPDYSSPTHEVRDSPRKSSAVFENGFFFPQPPSPNFFPEPPTPEFTGK